MSYWLPGGPFGFGGAAGQSSNTYGNFPSFDGRDAGGGSASTRYNFSNGWFVGSEGGGLGLSGINQNSAFGNFPSVSYQGVQVGYNFQNSPLKVYGGVDTLKYNAGIGSPFAPFDTVSGTLPGYSAHAGVEFRPTSNVSLSLGVGYTQTPGDINSFSLPGASPLAISGRR